VGFLVSAISVGEAGRRPADVERGESGRVLVLEDLVDDPVVATPRRPQAFEFAEEWLAESSGAVGDGSQGRERRRALRRTAAIRSQVRSLAHAVIRLRAHLPGPVRAPRDSCWSFPDVAFTMEPENQASWPRDVRQE
jgi:hypothetical protein